MIRVGNPRGAKVLAMVAEKTKTKIVCTIGPATSSKPTLRRLTRAGMNVARLNLSHGTLDEHAARMRLIRAVSRETNTSVGILLDLPGPKIRLGKILPEPVELRDGAQLTLTSKRIIGNERVVSLSHPSILKTLRKGDRVYLEDGIVQLTVLQANKDQTTCRIVRGGHISSGKGVNLPGKKLRLGALTKQDLGLLRFAAENETDFIALSFVTTAGEVAKAQQVVEDAGSKAWIIAKIEKHEAVENLDQIVNKAQGVMVARGDLGIEMELEDIPSIQKEIITKANAAGKPVITATQMLESMVNNSVPTRAEVTDIANAIIDGTDAVMLSEETAVGSYPVEAVNVMKRVADATEKNLPYNRLLNAKRRLLRPIVQDLISYSACVVAYRVGAGCIVAHTRTGLTAHRVSKFRSPVPIIALTYSLPVMNRLSLLWGVYPYRVKKLSTTAEIFSAAKVAARHTGTVSRDSKIVVVCGDPSTPGGTTDLLRVQTI